MALVLADLENAHGRLVSLGRRLEKLPGYQRVRDLAENRDYRADSLAWSLAGDCFCIAEDLKGEHIPALRQAVRETEVSIAREEVKRRAEHVVWLASEERKAKVATFRDCAVGAS